MRQFVISATLCASIAGCGGGGSVKKLTSLETSFAMIENSVADLHANINDKNYRGTAGDLGSDSDRLGMALAHFAKAAQGKPVATAADDIGKKLVELEKLVAARAPLEKQKAAVEQLQAAVAAAKAKL